jgi:multidrug efflux pump subunit AcrB
MTSTEPRFPKKPFSESRKRLKFRFRSLLSKLKPARGQTQSLWDRVLNRPASFVVSALILLAGSFLLVALIGESLLPPLSSSCSNLRSPRSSRGARRSRAKARRMCLSML